MTEEDYYDFDTDNAENGFRLTCPNCHRTYDHIDFDFQSCSKCRYDAENECFSTTRSPSNEDFLNGDADILTGEWN